MSKHQSNRLLLLREHQRLTIREMAGIVGMAPSTYFRIENGAECMLSTAIKLAKFFGVTVNDIWPM